MKEINEMKERLSAMDVEMMTIASKECDLKIELHKRMERYFLDSNVLSKADWVHTGATLTCHPCSEIEELLKELNFDRPYFNFNVCVNEVGDVLSSDTFEFNGGGYWLTLSDPASYIKQHGLKVTMNKRIDLDIKQKEVELKKLIDLRTMIEGQL